MYLQLIKKQKKIPVTLSILFWNAPPEALYMSPVYLPRDGDAILKLSRPEQARRRRTWENQLVLNSIAALATRINGSFRGYCSRVVVFPLVRATLFDGRTAVWHTLERTNTPEGAA